MTSSPPVVRPGLPAVRHVPAHVSSAGPDAVELAASAGLTVDPWQADVLEGALGERADGKWAAFEVGVIASRQTGKGTILEVRTLAGLTLFGEQLIMWSAHETKTAFELFRRMEELISGSDELRKRVKRVSRANGDEGIEMTNGARLRFVARSKGSGRGFSGDLIILDEAYALSEEHTDALIPTQSARPNAQVWYTSSPPLDGASGGKLFDLRRRALAGDDDLAWFDWGPRGLTLDQVGESRDDGTPVLDLDDRALWYATNPAMPYRITEETVARERRALSPEGFARERLCVWPRRLETGSGIISMQQWSELADPPQSEDDRPEDVAFALVVNRDRTRSAIAYAGLRGDGLLQVGVSDWRPGTSWVVERLLQLRERWNPVGVAVHARSESLLLDLEKAGVTAPDNPDEPMRGDLAVPSAAADAAAYGLFVDAVRKQALRHADDAAVNVALQEARARPSAGGATWDDKSGEVAPLRALCQALWLWESRAHLVTGDFDPVEQIF